MGPEYFWGGGMWLFPIIMIIAVITICFLWGRGGFRFPCCSMADRHNGPGKEPESASEILNKRYVRGEISKEEFERMKRDIQSWQTPV